MVVNGGTMKILTAVATKPNAPRGSQKRSRGRGWPEWNPGEGDAVGVGEVHRGGDGGVGEAGFDEAKGGGGAGRARETPGVVEADVMVVTIGREETRAGIGTLRDDEAEGRTA